MRSKIEVTFRQQGSDVVRIALVREDLRGLRAMKESVEKRIEQLQFDAAAGARQLRLYVEPAISEILVSHLDGPAFRQMLGQIAEHRAADCRAGVATSRAFDRERRLSAAVS